MSRYDKAYALINNYLGEDNSAQIKSLQQQRDQKKKQMESLKTQMDKLKQDVININTQLAKLGDTIEDTEEDK